jgi:hypothetical protein
MNIGQIVLTPQNGRGAHAVVAQLVIEYPAAGLLERVKVVKSNGSASTRTRPSSHVSWYCDTFQGPTLAPLCWITQTLSKRDGQSSRYFWSAKRPAS